MNRLSRRLITLLALSALCLAVGITLVAAEGPDNPVPTPQPEVEDARPTDVIATPAGDSAVVVVWKTAKAVAGWIEYGPSLDKLDGVAFDDRGQDLVDTKHQVTVKDLEPDTAYYYVIVSGERKYDNAGFLFKTLVSKTVGPKPIPPTEIKMAPGTVVVEKDVETAVRQALGHASAELTAVDYYAVSAVDEAENWLFVSVVGLKNLNSDLDWNLLDNGIWFGLVLLRQDKDGHWAGATEGTAEFSLLLTDVPERILSTEAKQGLDPRQRRLLSTSSTYSFPWQSGTKMQYGQLGVHANGFSGVVSGWKAVDFLSDGNTSVGHAPNRLLAAAAGTIGYVCRVAGQDSVAIRIGDLFYTHLLNNANLQTGRYFNQGSELGQLKSGSFNQTCGYASQGSNWFHVHWGFPNTGSFQAEGWTINWNPNLSGSQYVSWTRSNETVGVNGWMLAGGGGGKPDLVVDSISFSPSNPTVGQSVAFTIRIRNQGTGAASLTMGPNLERQERSSREGVNGDQSLSNFWLDFYVDHQPTGCGDWASVAYWQVSSLAPGATRDFTYNYTFNTAGTHNLWAFVDSECTVPESNEGNNIRGPVAINVTGSKPDLVVDSISFNPSNPTVGQSVAFTIRIRNQGTGAASLTIGPNLERQERSSREGVNGDQSLSNFYLDFYVDHQPTGCGDWASVAYWTVSSLAPGATRDFTYNYTFNTAGTHNLWAFVDSGCMVPESNEGNNIRGPVAINVVQGGTCSGTAMSFEQTVGGSLSNSTPSRNYCFTASAGQWVSIRMFAYNSSLDTYIKLYKPDGQLFAENDDGAGVYNNSFLVRQLPQSGTYRLEATRWGSTSGDYRLRLEAGREAALGDLDRNCVVNETDRQRMVNAIGSSDQNADLNLDGIVNTVDYSILLGRIGRTCS